MKIAILLMILSATGLLVLAALWLYFKLAERHDPVEYYSGWSGYGHPVRLGRRITRGEADAQAARGYAYLIAYFDADNRLGRVDKIIKGELFFRFEYNYHPNGRLKLAKVSHHDGRSIAFEYDGRGRKLSTSAPGFW
jgi:YD repeat-containing protein